MNNLSNAQIISALCTLLQKPGGRHLYMVLGTYTAIESFISKDLCSAMRTDGTPFPAPLRFNQALLASIEDEALRRLVRDEHRRPLAVESQLNQAFEQLLRHQFEEHPFLILEQCELMFAYSLDLSKLRTFATDEHHLLLLLPGKQVSNQMVLFHEAEQRFLKQFPSQLVTENHLWELNV